MPGILRKLLSFRKLLNRRKSDPDEAAEEKWIADFSKEKHARFHISREGSYDTSLRKNPFYSGHSLVLSLRKAGCIAWTEAPLPRYRDLVISGVIRVDPMGGYGAGGMFFRMVDASTYYSFLISSKGYFRLDVLRNGMPFPLVGWTELPLSRGAALGPDEAVDFSIIAYGTHIVILIRGRWAAEISDSSISEGSNCFAAASYEPGEPARGAAKNPGAGEAKNAEALSCAAEVFLESLTVESRITEVSSFHEKWYGGSDVDSTARIKLAETFTAMNQYNAAMVQIRKAWETPGHRKSQRELLLAGRLAQALNLMTEAESFIGQCLETEAESPEGKAALTEMAKILYTGDRFAELKNFCAEAVKKNGDDPVLRIFEGHAYWNLKEYREAAAAYDTAFKLDGENGIPAKNAANVYDVMGRKKEALARYLDAGRAFMNAGNYNDLGLLIPVLLSLGKDNWEARSLAGKWAFAVEDWNMAEAEFGQAEELRMARRPKPRKDGAQVFLTALLLARAGKRGEALPLFEEAVSLEKNYALFHFRLAENLFLLNDDPGDPRMLDAVNAALALLEDDSPGREISAAGGDEGLAGWIYNFAAQTALGREDLDSAARYLEKAGAVLGDLPAVRVNRALLFYLRGSLDKALALLDEDKQNDPEGVMANCAGNLLVRAGRFEEADEKYRRALSAGRDNVEYLTNRASCLLELSLYGEADELLARAHTIAPSPAILEMISYVAVKKGEYSRAEQACRSALEMEPAHAPSLLSLGWILLTLGREEEARETLKRLDKLKLRDDTAKSREELRGRLDDLAWTTVNCVSCDRAWKLPKNPEPVPAIRLFAMPPDDLPAGSCPGCGKTYCIGCAKKNLDPDGRFVCLSCGRPLKLVNDGLKKILHDWAVTDGLVKSEAVSGETLSEAPPVPAKRGRPPKTVKESPASGVAESETLRETDETSPSVPAGRGRGRPRKTLTAPETGLSPGEIPAEAPPVPAKRGRGRPPKTVESPRGSASLKRPRGRPVK